MTDKLISLENEIWKPVVGYEGLYEISNTGKIKSFYRNRLIKLSLDSYGYPIVSLYKDSKSKTITVHKLLTMAFLGNRPEGYVCDHINGIRADNRLENLQYVTPRENTVKGKATHATHRNIHYYKKPRSKHEYWIVHVSINGKQIRKCATSLQKAIEKRDKIMLENNITLTD